MPSFPIQLKRNGTAAATPSSLLHGEVALNYADGKLFWKDASNVIQSFTFQAYATSSSPAFTGAATFANTGNVVPLTVTNTGTANSFVVNDASGDTSPFVIDADGNVGIGGAASSFVKVHVLGTMPGNPNVQGFRMTGEVPSTTTGSAVGYVSFPTTQAASFTVSQLLHFSAAQGTFGAGSSVTNQFGFIAQSSLTGATNNYGFYSDIASGTGRWNFYANGTAANYFAGNVGIGTTAPSNKLSVSNAGAEGLELIPAQNANESRIQSYNRSSAAWNKFSINCSTFEVFCNGGTSAISIATTAAVTLGGQLLVTAGSGSAGSYKPGVAVSGDNDTGLQQVGGAGTISLVTQGSERVRVDASGKVGIGVTTNLTAALNFPQADSGEVINYFPSETEGVRSGVGKYSAEVRHYVPAGDFFAWRTGGPSGTERMKLSASLLTVGSSVSITASQVYSDTVGATNRDLFVDNTGKFGYVSSIRASKTNIAAIDDVSWLRDLTPVSFHYRKRNEDGTYSDEADGTLDYGLIAEEVEPVAPEMCFYDVVDGEPQLRGVHYSKLITPMLRYIQQLEQRIAALEERLNHA